MTKVKRKNISNAAKECIYLLDILNNPLLKKKQKKIFLNHLTKQQVNNLVKIVADLLYNEHKNLTFDNSSSKYIQENLAELQNFSERNKSYKNKKNILKKKGGFLPFLAAALPVIKEIAGPVTSLIGSLFKK